MIKAVIKLVSSYRHHGSAGPKPTKIRSTAASKFNAIMNKRQEQSTDDSSDSKTESGSGSKSKSQPKPYGSHNGNLQVAVLKDVIIDDSNKEEVTTYITNLTSQFEGRNSWDLRAAKHSYKVYKDNLTNEYAAKYGEQLSEKVTTEMLARLATKAFYYTSHQIVITIESDQPIEGGRLGEDNHYFITIKSKMVYTCAKTLLSDAEVKALKATPTDEVRLRVTTVTRVPAILTWDAKNQRYVVTYKGSGSVTAHDDYS